MLKDGESEEIMKHKLNTLQENLTNVNVETVEDLHFSKFLVIKSFLYTVFIGQDIIIILLNCWKIHEGFVY